MQARCSAAFLLPTNVLTEANSRWSRVRSLCFAGWCSCLFERACVGLLRTWRKEKEAGSARVKRHGLETMITLISTLPHHARHRVGGGGDLQCVSIPELLDRYCHILFSSIERQRQLW